MTDYSEQGAVPVEDAAVEDPPTVEEVLERQRREHPEQAESAIGGMRAPDSEPGAEPGAPGPDPAESPHAPAPDRGE